MDKSIITANLNQMSRLISKSLTHESFAWETDFSEILRYFPLIVFFVPSVIALSHSLFLGFTLEILQIFQSFTHTLFTRCVLSPSRFGFRHRKWVNLLYKRRRRVYLSHLHFLLLFKLLSCIVMMMIIFLSFFLSLSLSLSVSQGNPK